MGVLNWLRDMFNRPMLPREHRDDRLISLVLLLREPRCLDAEIIAQRLSDEFDRHIAPPSENSVENYVCGQDPTFILRFEEEFFTINHMDRPYMEQPDRVARKIAEMRLQKAMREHRAWLSVDYVGEPGVGLKSRVWQTIGRITASLLDDDCLALFAPGSGQFNLIDEQTANRLRSSCPYCVFEGTAHPPVIPVYGDDPRLRAAVATARRRWRQFERAFENRQPHQAFCVKARIGHEDVAEFMWISVTGMENGWVYGILDNDPIELKTVRCGDRLRVRIGDVNDWLIIDGNSAIGGFTIEVLRQIQDELQ